MLYFNNLQLPKRSKEYAYEMGKDCGLNGANVKNCSFSIFSSSENTKAWEDGKRDGKKARRIVKIEAKDEKRRQKESY